jgi:hypothetical protein
MLPDPIVTDVVARLMLVVRVEMDRRFQSVPVRSVLTEPDKVEVVAEADARVVNGSIVLYTTAAFDELTHATDRTIDEMKVLLRIWNS